MYLVKLIKFLAKKKERLFKFNKINFLFFQIAQKFPKIFRQGCIKFYIFSGSWMDKTKRFGMKCLPCQMKRAFCRPINRIPQNRIPDTRHVDTDLVGTPCLQITADISKFSVQGV